QLYKTDRFISCYTEQELHSVNQYFNDQLSKVDVEDITKEEFAFMKEMLLGMYANPLQNKLTALGDS
ncbi:MAG: acyltransferase, partial [Muribaculaceae bacterium]|nr:acyltransferase [Muribaculaceae bacterium]